MTIEEENGVRRITQIETSATPPPSQSSSPPLAHLTPYAQRRLVQREIVRHIAWMRRRGLLRYGGVLPNLERLGIKWDTMKKWSSTDDGYTPILKDTPLPPERPKYVPIIPPEEPITMMEEKSWLKRIIKR